VRVLVLSRNFPSAANPSAGTFVLEQICALRSLGIESVTIAPIPWPPPPLKFMSRMTVLRNVPRRSEYRGFAVDHPRRFVLPREWPFSCSGLFYYLSCRSLIANRLREGSIDLIHAHAIAPDGFAAILLGRKFHLPVVCTAHGSDINVYPHRGFASRRVTQWVLNKADRVIAVSEHLKDNIFRLAGRRHVDVIRNGADLAVFAPVRKDQARTKLGVPQQNKILLYLGRLTAIKDIPLLLDTMNQLSCPAAHLYLVGDGELRPQLEAKAKQLGIANHCSFVGNRPHDEVPLWLSAADCLVLCSKMEGLPTVLPEAMMCQVPVVATSVGGIPEVIQHGKTGLLVYPGDAAALRNAIELVLTNEILGGNLVKSAATMARRQFTWQANAEKTAIIYREAVRDFRRSCDPTQVVTAVSIQNRRTTGD
jgi:teichuronic acid biosynthesis glycosyltransferase TuaC